MLGMHCMDRDEAWHVLHSSSTDAAERLSRAENKLEMAVNEVNAALGVKGYGQES